MFHVKKMRLDISYESSAEDSHEKSSLTMQKYSRLSSAAVVIGAIRVKCIVSGNLCQRMSS